MRENWEEIIYVLQTDFKVGMLENKFRDDIAYCLRILGWKPYNGSVRREVSLPIGNNNSIRPDFVLHKDSKEIPIEVKRPGNDCNERQEKQLLSYMRQLKSNVGIYIGSDIRFFYDDPNDSADAICVYKIEFDENDDKGITFCELLSYDSFDKEYFELFCKDQYDRINYQEKLKNRIDDFFSDSDFDSNIKNLIADLFVKEGFDKNEVEKELSGIYIDVSRNLKKYTTVSTVDTVVIKQRQYQVSDNSGKYEEEFSLDGRNYCGIGRFVLAVVNKYIEDNPHITFEKLEGKFNSYTSRAVVRIYDEIVKLSKTNEDIQRRFFIKNPIRLNDGIKIVVDNQWGNNNNCRKRFQEFLEHINKFYSYYRRDKRTNEVKFFPKKTY